MSYADIVLINATVINPGSEQSPAQAIAIKHGKIMAVGTSKQILSLVGQSTKKIDIDGRTILPGFIECHAHGVGLGQSFSETNLRRVKSIREIQDKIKEWTKKTSSGCWIVGRGWDQDKLSEHRYPTWKDLDEVSPNHPVLLIRVCGHLGVINSEAMRQAGITKETQPPEGGRIDIDHGTKMPNGILRENALDLVFKVLPERSRENLTETILQASQKMIEEGITTVHWIISSGKELRTLQRLIDQNKLPIRIYAMIPVEYLDNLVELGITTGFGDDRIRIGSVKILADGSLGARTAALKDPYTDSPKTKGMLLYSERQLKKFIEKAHNANLQLAIHAIGDKTIEIILHTLKKILQKNPNLNHRHRLEHASVLNPNLIQEMKEINMIASVQPHFIISDFWVADRLGESRARWTYALKSMFKEGIVMIGGSDAPVEPVSPILGMYAATARKTFPQERLTITEALRLYTSNAAYASFEEDTKGSIEKGKLADLVVLSENPFQTPHEQLKQIKVVMTIVAGKIVYERRPE
ncbi:amidohydrolase [Candidatus Bathyarchaeota archaeon]|nr:MAG: amidohydrolase [Candidatus Bathyarchaeota archaeon]